MATKSGQNLDQLTRGTIINIDDNNIALVNTPTQQFRVRADMLRGKSAAPKVGETWILDQPYGVWMFAVPMNYLGGDQDFTAPVMTNGWTSLGGIYLPVGYIKDSENWVTLRGRLHGGSAGLAAFTLPTGYLPGAQIPFVLPGGTSSTSAYLNVTALGQVVPLATADISLEQVRFLAQG